MSSSAGSVVREEKGGNELQEFLDCSLLTFCLCNTAEK